MTFLFAGAAALAEPTHDELEQRRRQLTALRKHPEQVARLRENLKPYLDLPEKRRQAIIKLDQDLQALPLKEQERLTHTLERYAGWLEQLRAQDPQAYQAIKHAPDAPSRAALIKDRRDREWMNQQPRALREQWEKLSGAARADFVAGRRREERQRHEQWLIAKRFWRELESKQPLPCRLSDYSPRVKDYVSNYLWPYLTEAEKKHLEGAEGRWPDYPQSLVEVASKHRPALPAETPRKFARLPEPVRHRLIESRKGITQKRLEKEIRQYEGPGFASNLVKIGLREGKFPLDHEYLAPNYNSLQKPMKAFVDQVMLPVLEQSEARKLSDSERKWPEYPRMIQELAQHHHLVPPWHILPEPERWKWAEYGKSSGRSWGSDAAREKKNP